MIPTHKTKLGNLYQGDCRKVCLEFPDNHFTTVITDPPYELGFMGKKWDSSGVAFQIETWKEVLRVCKPGAIMLAFGGTRTHHRLMCAIEDAGWEIRDVMMWLYGSGFPKSHNIGKNVEKIKVGGIKNLKQIGSRRGLNNEDGTSGFSYQKEYVPGKSIGGKQIQGEIPVYDIDNEWIGYGTALKPAYEPIIVAMKPLDGTFANNAMQHGVSGLNIEKSRIATASNESPTEKDPLLSALGTASFDTLESCLDWLSHISTELLPCNTNDKDLLHNVYAQDDRLTSGVGYGLLLELLYPNGVWCGYQLYESLNSQSDYQHDLRFCDALFRYVQDCAQGGPPLLCDALSDISHFLSEPSHILCLNTDHPSNSDAFHAIQSLCTLLIKCFVYHITKHSTLSNTNPGRWPANIILSHHPECELVGVKKIHNKSGSVTGKEPSKPTNNAYGEYNRIPSIKYGNTDGTETVESWNCHPDCPIGILDDQSGITSTGDTNAIPYTNTTGKNVYGKQTGIKKAMKGDTGGASRFFYCAKTSKAERGEGNTHPTVKPMDLIRYLVTLTSPPRDAHILDPFIGSGTLALVCEKLDITYTGIDLDCDIAIDRIKDATRQMKLF